MKLSELIAHYGDERVQFQYLDECLVGAQLCTQGLQITFGTQAVSAVELAAGKTMKTAIILWLDRERIAEILKQEKGTP